MKIFAVMLVALTAVAHADEHGGRVTLGKQQHPAAGRVHDGAWTELASTTSAAHGTEYVMIGREAGRYSQLRVVADNGWIEVRRLHVFFGDGSDHTYEVDRAIGRHHERAVTVPLNVAKEIERIAVTTSRESEGNYSVYGL
jgi:hypothetical protein